MTRIQTRLRTEVNQLRDNIAALQKLTTEIREEIDSRKAANKADLERYAQRCDRTNIKGRDYAET